MQVKASLKNYRKSARKVREIANVLRGMDIENGVFQLMVMEKGAREDILNLLKSAVANAESNFKLKEDDLYISEIKVNEGPTLKRWRPRAHGRAFKILKRTCHVEIILDEKLKKNPTKKIESVEKKIAEKKVKSEKKMDTEKKESKDKKEKKSEKK